MYRIWGRERFFNGIFMQNGEGYLSLPGTACMHKIKHHGLLILNQRGMSISNHLVSQVQKGRNDLDARFINAILLTEYLDQPGGNLSRNVKSRAHNLDTQPDD